MERARMLGMEQVVAGGTEGGRSPTGVPPAAVARSSELEPQRQPIVFRVCTSIVSVTHYQT